MGRIGQSKRSYPRVARLNQVIREVLADSLERISDDDPRLDLLTITEVKVDPDMRNAKVFLSRADDDVLEALEESRAALQRALARQMTMKRTPHLYFELDHSIESGARIDRIIKSIDLGDDGEA